MSVTSINSPVVYDPFSAAFKADPWPVYRRLRDEAPVYHSKKWGFWALSRFDDVRAAARDHQSYLSFEGIDIDDTAKDMRSAGFLPDIDNPRHDQLRRIVQRTFLPRSIAKLEHDVRQVISGTCETPVLDGEPDHRDSVLTDEEKRAGDRMMICVSRSRHPAWCWICREENR